MPVNLHDELPIPIQWQLPFLAHALVFLKCCLLRVNRTALALFGLLAAGGGMIGAQAGTMVTFVPPSQGLYVKNGQFVATLNLTGTAMPNTLQVMSNNRDVTSLFNVSSCSQAPCTLAATLVPGNGVVAGQNFLAAKIQGAHGAAETARMRFAYNTGLIADPTDGTAPGYLVPVKETITGTFHAFNTTITIGTPTPTTVSQCSGGLIQITVLNRNTLAPLQDLSGCVTDVNVKNTLSRFDESQIVIVLSPPAGTGAADFSPIGGTHPGASLFGYAAIGYGGASQGTAYEAWLDPNWAPGAPIPTISGNLADVGCAGLHTIGSNGGSGPPAILPGCNSDGATSFYAFLGTDTQGFAIVPGAAGTPGNPGLPTIYVGNSSNVPLGDSTAPTNQIRPMNSTTGTDAFSYHAYSQPWRGGPAAGGIFLLVLNRADLSVVLDEIFVTNCGCSDHGADNDAIAQVGDRLVGSNFTNLVFMLTTVGVPFNADSNTMPLLQAFLALGVSPSAIQGIIPDRIGTPARAGFSLVAYSQQSSATVTDKLFSSAANTQQHETGALRGVFAKQHSPYYEAINVSPFDVADLPVYPTGDDFLAHATSFAIGSTEPVAWPHMSTTGEVAAYHYLSQKLVDANFYGGDPGQCRTNCFDIRFYYTGDQASIVYAHLQPGGVPYPGDAVASADQFTQTDFLIVQQQLGLEQLYLGEVVNYKNYLVQLNNGATVNVGLTFTQAGTSIANTLYNELKLSQPEVKDTPLHISADTFNILAGAVSNLGAYQNGNLAFKVAVPLVSGISWTLSAILACVADAQKTKAAPDPYVAQLEQIWSDTEDTATTAAINFNADLESANTVFFNGVFSDWFRLQSSGLLALNKGYGGWYVADSDQASGLQGYFASILVNQRTKMWQQILPQYFMKAGYNAIATGWLASTGTYPTISDADRGFLGKLPGKLWHTSNFGWEEYQSHIRLQLSFPDKRFHRGLPGCRLPLPDKSMERGMAIQYRRYVDGATHQRGWQGQPEH